MEPMAFLLFEKGGILLYESVQLPGSLNVVAARYGRVRHNEDILVLKVHPYCKKDNH